MKEETETVEVTLGRAFKVWWSLVWRFYLFVALFAVAVEGVFLGGAYLIGEEVSEVFAAFYLGLRGLVFGASIILVSIAVVQAVLKKKFSDFRIVLMKRDDKPKDEQKQ